MRSWEKFQVRILRPVEFEKLREAMDPDTRRICTSLLLTGMRYAELQRFGENPDWMDGKFVYLPRGSMLKVRAKQREKIRDYLKQREHELKWLRARLIIRVLGESCVRVSELVRINVEDMSEKGFFNRSSKREKNRFVAVSPATVALAHEYISARNKPGERALFDGDYGRLKTAVIRNIVSEAGKAAGVKRLHPHALRHFGATRLLRAGLDLRKIQAHLGHASIQSTQLYTHLISSDVQAEIYDIYASMREPGFFLVEAEALL